MAKPMKKLRNGLRAEPAEPGAHGGRGATVRRRCAAGSSDTRGVGVAEKIRVLSIDGGGIRGIIPALVLAEIDERTGKPCGVISGCVSSGDEYRTRRIT